ncbi:sn-glycerol-3-phosphate import ATP-binding protein UgpC [Varunaivibrio sulfuroxidans]|uniref:sn-glycerol 3-phosphate transport system ATP-binding protein n=1 Tax=Varunaivibrio sulfuroxidans TaxID=1773489 RepID=A0A4R3JE72_9PROT|nr:sn-glycerol-3-phosphate import ATP-binding protein UgpC [Varunaivibrio sulfuroxidans]TCS64172.1 sn-glycerol 3-phosphate transport system ATP-binding protein [Varunaivibrio sulfuroxidans]WES31382.1 sn-glycerol-3-phosphate import ATP-binding protein UgpC [Varunaivibrio sulfuroxidans]
MANVTIKNVKKTYPNGFKAIHGVNIDIADGEFVVLVGPSGCGKSTLLRMIAGLETINDGDVHIAGRRVNDLEPAQRDIAMVFQNYALYPHMSVYANMAYGLKIRGLKKREIDEKVRKAAAILELDDAQLLRKPKLLSGGQRQRVAMGRAIVREPAVFLFDEPLSNLDAKLRVQMRLEIKRLQETLGVTSLYVTHDQVEAMTLGHRLMVMNAGIVEQIGTPIELYAKPATPFVASFIGSPAMNLIDVKLDAESAHILLPDGQTLSTAGLTFANGARYAGGDAVILGIRPEHLRLTDAERAQFHLHVATSELLGADTLLHGHFGREKTALTIRVSGIVRAKAGEIVGLDVGTENLHLFDNESGRRMVQ